MMPSSGPSVQWDKWFVHAMEYYTSTQKTEALLYVSTGKDLQEISLSKKKNKKLEK